MSAQLNFPRTLYGSQAFFVANTSELHGRSICGLWTWDEIMDRSDDDHHDELERCPRGDAGEWLSNVDDLDGTAESAREMNMFFIHLTISSDNILGWCQRPLDGAPRDIFSHSTDWEHLVTSVADVFSQRDSTRSTVSWFSINKASALILKIMV